MELQEVIDHVRNEYKSDLAKQIAERLVLLGAESIKYVKEGKYSFNHGMNVGQSKALSWVLEQLNSTERRRGMKCKNCNKPGCPHRTTDSEKECVYSQALGHDPLTFEQMKELQQMQLQHDWEALRNQAAISAMQGMLSNSFDHELMTPDNVAKQSVKYADALVKELKESDT